MVRPRAPRLVDNAAPQAAPEDPRANNAPTCNRLGIDGSLSPASSLTASAAASFAARDVRRNRHLRGSRGTVFKCPTIAGGVNVRSPEIAPIPAAKARVDDFIHTNPFKFVNVGSGMPEQRKG